MTLDELSERVATGEIDTVVVAFTDHVGRAMGKRLDAGFFLDETVAHGTHGCNYLFTVDMDMEPVPGFRYANWSGGYGDFHLVPDLATLRRAAWADRTAFVLCDVADGDTHELVPVAPRTILRRQIDRAAALGYEAKAASELEYFAFTDTYRDANDRSYHGLTTAGWYNEDYHLLQGFRGEPFNGAARRALRDSGIPVESTKGEAARGQHEINVRYAEALTMADRHVVLKQALKELADAQGMSITFMAKPVEGESGSSCHVHLSLWSGDDAVFPGGGADGESDVFRWFLGGWMAYLPDFMVCYAPTINAYKRYQEDSWAPTRIAWARDNRTAGFRVVGSGPSLRIECRIPGADVNPYLVYAAALASGLTGIEQKIEPPARYDGDLYRATDQPGVPTTLEEAVERFTISEVTRACFGDDVVEHYAHFHRSELAAWRAAVTDWERRRYFERI